MLRSPSLSLGLLAVFGIAPFAAAQDPDVPMPSSPERAVTPEPLGQPDLGGFDLAAPFIVPIHTGESDLGQPYGTWAVGHDYKVSFHDGMTLIPYLGEGYPHNQTFRWTTQSVTVGGVELIQGEPTTSATDYRYEYRFGAVTEAYDVLGAGVEQTFVIHRDPGQAGDLVVRGAIDAPHLTADRFGGHGAVTFRDGNGDEILTYGEAYVVDAAGRKAEIETRYGNGEFELTVPAGWLAQATWPVTVDPLIGPNVGVSYGSNRQDVDICWDDGGDDVYFCFSRISSGSDRDLYLRVIDAALTASGGSGGTIVWNDVTSTWTTYNAAIARTGSTSVSSGNRIGLIFERRFPTVGNVRNVRAHFRDAGDTTLSSAYTGIAGTTSLTAWRPDIGGTLLGTGSTFMMVWQQENNGTGANSSTSEVWCRSADAATASSPSLGTAFQMAPANFTGTDLERPKVNRSARADGANTEWLVCWQELIGTSPTTDDWDLGLRMVNATSAASGDLFFQNGNSDHKVGPDVAGADGRYMLSFGERTNNTTLFRPLNVQAETLNVVRVDGTFASAPTTVSSTNAYVVATNLRWVVGGIAYDDDSESQWTTTYLSNGSFGGTGTLYYGRFGFTGIRIETGVLDGGSSGDDVGPGGVDFNDDADDFFMAWSRNTQPSSTGTFNTVEANRLEYLPYTLDSSYGTACSSASINWVGFQRLGSEFGYVSVSGMPANAFTVLLIAGKDTSVDLTPFGLPGCTLLVENSGPMYFGSRSQIASATGSARFPIPLPGNLLSGTAYFQAFHTDTLPPTTFLATQGRKVEITK